ncbi:MAG: hypothetical protein ACYDA6_05810 [Solirubrobacteraceae bacterium]
MPALLASPVTSQAQPQNTRWNASHRATAHHGYVSGQLDLAHYTVLVVGYNGRIASSRARHFRIPAPDARVTVQLVNASGHYAGPVILGSSGTRVITGVKAPVNLGMIDVVASQGYAHLARKLARRHLDRARWAYAKHGVPVGNGRNLGLVSSGGRGGGAGAGQDEAHVGIPNELDVALPGTHVLRALAPAAKAKRARASAASRQALSAAVAPSEGGEAHPGEPCPPGSPPEACKPPPPGGSAPPGSPSGGPQPSAISPWMSQLFLSMNETINIDAAGATVSEIDSTLKARLNLKLLGVPSAAGLLELNCNGLSFCAQGGTGQAVLEGLPQNEPNGSKPAGVPADATAPTAGGAGWTVPFPAGSLDSSNGFGEVVGPAAPSTLLGTGAGGGHEFSLNPNATSSQIGSGDVVTLVASHEAATSQIPTTIDFVFNTVPAIASYSDTAGDSASVSYPDTSNLGTMSNPLKVAAGPNGDVVMTFTLYRPQRQGVAGAGEPAFMDIGNLGYELDYVPSAPAPGSTTIGSATSPQCPSSSYSNLSPTLTLGTGTAGGFGPPAGEGWLVDSAADHPAKAAETISFAVDLTQCMAAKGTTSFAIGHPVQFDVSANSQSSSDHANQTFVVERVR